MLQLAGASATVLLAGCGGGDGGDGNGNGDGDGGDDVVPDEYSTATAQAGAQRDPDALSTKSALDYQDSPNDGERCDGCQFYILDKNDDGMGACTLVEGNIDPAGWCSSYTAYQG